MSCHGNQIFGGIGIGRLPDFMMNGVNATMESCCHCRPQPRPSCQQKPSCGCQQKPTCQQQAPCQNQDPCCSYTCTGNPCGC